ncbi:MAG: S-layer protein, partial [Gemmata sp.]
MRFCLPLLLLAAPSVARAADGLHFENDILPVLGRHGCNTSGCHGKAEGQGGLKLSVFASDPEADHAAVTKEARGRRVLPSAPDESLFLRKASGRTPHGGGTRIPAGSEDYKTLRDWIAAG